MKKYTLSELSRKFDLSFKGNGDLLITTICGHKRLTANGIAYCIQENDLDSINTPDDAVLIVKPGSYTKGKNFLYSTDPLETHIQITNLFYRQPAVSKKIHPTAIIGKDVEIGENVTIDAHVVLYEHVKIGHNSVIRAGTVIMEETVIGEHCQIDPNVTIGERCSIGNRVIIHGGAVIGASGFGFYQKNGEYHKIPQIGQVIIEDDVEIGPATIINRGRLDATIVKKGCKLDGHVFISHNVELGEHSVIAGQSAIAGSTKIGHHFLAGGQTGVTGHLTLGNNITLMARGVITKNTADGLTLAGFPARIATEWKRTKVYINRLSSLFLMVKMLNDDLQKRSQIVAR